jgi:hypothetical protein
MNRQIWVEYRWPPGVNVARDEELESLAGKHGGERDGSGFMFQTSVRDVSFRFKSPKRARAFADAAVKLSWVTKCDEVG